MDTSSFKPQINKAACDLENDMRAICGIGATRTATLTEVRQPTDKPAPLTPDELILLNNLLATKGRGSMSRDQENALAQLNARYVANGGTYPIPGLPPNVEPAPIPLPAPSAGSFATNSIDNFQDFMNFMKAACVIGFGASLNPVLAMPTQIILGASLIYALRFQIQKLTFKFNIHGHQ